MGIACVPPTQFVSYRMSFRGHLPTEGLCTYVMLCWHKCKVYQVELQWRPSWRGAKHYHLVYKNANLQRSATHHGMRASRCIHVYTYTPIHVYMYSRPHEYILKEEDQDIIIRLEGRENEGWCCEPVPFSTNGHAVVSNWLSGNRLRPTYSVCKLPLVVSWAPSDWGTLHLRHALLT